MAVIPVELAGRSYEVRVGHGLVHDLSEHAAPFLRKTDIPVVADRNAREFWGASVEKALGVGGKTARWYDVALVALGGGVVGDLTGFACAILKRGCGFIQVPTTLLAQVDSSVGGKTAINSAAGKNLIGAFHQPSLVLADLATLDTLPDREMRAGYAEVLKYGVLGDAEFFAWLEDNGSAVLARDPAALEQAVATSVSAKARIVAEDERETTGARALLNLGHTFGHALEAETGFSDRLLHGEAVALGMILAARYSARRGLLSEDAAQRLTRAADAAGLPSEIAALGIACSGRDLADHMLHDKKMDAGTLPFLLLRSIGAAFLTKDVALDDVALFLDEELQAH